jgi:hypothetical protein
MVDPPVPIALSPQHVHRRLISSPLPATDWGRLLLEIRSLPALTDWPVEGSTTTLYEYFQEYGG